MFRHSIERMDPAHYLSSSYWEHWLTGVTTMAVEAGAVTQDELDRRAGGHFPLSRPDRGVLPDDLTARTEHRYSVGDTVRVREWHPRATPAHLATCRASAGSIVRIDPAYECVRHRGARRRVRHRPPLLCPVHIPRALGRRRQRTAKSCTLTCSSGICRRRDGRPPPSRRSGAGRGAHRGYRGRTRGKGHPRYWTRWTPIVAHFENNLGPMNGAKVVARAWADPEYKARLNVGDGTAAIAELGFSGPEGDHMVVVENSSDIHNLVVCTLCSCYPWPTLGLPPKWYEAPAYRARAVREPRTMLAEMGTVIPAMSRSACGIPVRRRGTWYCRCGRQAQTICRRSNSRASSRATL